MVDKLKNEVLPDVSSGPSSLGGAGPACQRCRAAEACVRAGQRAEGSRKGLWAGTAAVRSLQQTAVPCSSPCKTSPACWASSCAPAACAPRIVCPAASPTFLPSLLSRPQIAAKLSDVAEGAGSSYPDSIVQASCARDPWPAALSPLQLAGCAPAQLVVPVNIQRGLCGWVKGMARRLCSRNMRGWLICFD